MKLSLRIIMAFCLTLMLNTLSFGASYSTVIGEPIEETVVKENFRNKAKNFLQNRVLKKVKNRFKDIKDTWKSYKEAKDSEGPISILLVIFLLLATATLVVLKILEIIAWSWLWVFAPLWIPIGLIILGGLFLIFSGIGNGL